MMGTDVSNESLSYSILLVEQLMTTSYYFLYIIYINPINLN